MQTGFNRLNDMIDSWTTERLFIWATKENVSTLGVGTQTLTIGPGGQINTPGVQRPMKLSDRSFVRWNNLDYPLALVNQEQYSSLQLKTQTSTLPSVAYYEPSLPLGVIHFWPLSTVGLELHLQLEVQLSQFADLMTDYALPQGYNRAIIYSLAEELGPQYRTPDPKIGSIAAKARSNIKRMNKIAPILGMPPGLSLGVARHRFNIYTGE